MDKPQKTAYLFPHKLKTWPQQQSRLERILQQKQLQNIQKIMNQFDQRAVWSSKKLMSYINNQQKLIKVIQFAAQNALQITKLFTYDIHISQPIQQDEGMSYITLTKKQALCIVCNMFFSTVKQMPEQSKHSLPIYYNFKALSRSTNQVVRTVFNYFERSMQQIKINPQRYNNQHIVYIRIAHKTHINSWLTCQNNLCQVNYYPNGKIQDKQQSIQIDFANKSIGGFFLTATYTQQDIIFINNPQLMPALLFHRYMQPKQCILMVGAERYSLYDGYLQTYCFKQDYKDQRKTIKIQIQNGKWICVKDTWISAIDAIPYFIKSQFSIENLGRQLKKAYVGFNVMKLDVKSETQMKNISTGNWGSGAFMGNLQYKFLIQWLACSRAQRKMDYFAFQNENAELIPKIVEKYKNLKVGQLCNLMLQLQQKFQYRKKIFSILLTEQIKQIKQKVQEQNQDKKNNEYGQI